ncbi:hypothetical protein Acr_01g0015580 [Actinidia rufa]|uniref:Uncharacterized protein n=1 Tax=Actinidia rufa TaxID=165716 RepID=A0A7J0E5Q3_9ERIC|nr:hypothetical protein Acr_01g0015580 [Actinidia rufa]
MSQGALRKQGKKRDCIAQTSRPVSMDLRRSSPHPKKAKIKKTGQKVMNDLLKQVPPLPITLREYMPKKLISHKDDEEGDEEIQHVICAMIRVTEANEKKETKAMSEQGPNKTNRTDLHLEPLDEEEEDIQIWYKGRKAYR